MGGKVVSLLPNNALCVDALALGDRLREFGDRIAAGEFGPVERVVIVFETAEKVDRRTYGRPTSRMEVVGLLEYAKNRVLNPLNEDD